MQARWLLDSKELTTRHQKQTDYLCSGQHLQEQLLLAMCCQRQQEAGTTGCKHSRDATQSCTSRTQKPGSTLQRLLASKRYAIASAKYNKQPYGCQSLPAADRDLICNLFGDSSFEHYTQQAQTIVIALALLWRKGHCKAAAWSKGWSRVHCSLSRFKKYVSSKADLANDGGPSRPCDAPAKVHNKNSIQHNIDPIADDGGPQGGLGVSQPPKHPLQLKGMTVDVRDTICITQHGRLRDFCNGKQQNRGFTTKLLANMEAATAGDPAPWEFLCVRNCLTDAAVTQQQAPMWGGEREGGGYHVHGADCELCKVRPRGIKCRSWYLKD